MRVGKSGRVLRQLLLQVLRAGTLVLLAALGTITLMRAAPGYFTDERELDAQYSATGRSALAEQQQQEGSVAHLLALETRALLRGDLGTSRQFDVPVRELLSARAATSARLLAGSVLGGWLLALGMALALSGRRSRGGEALIAAPSALLLAVPVAALATLSLLTEVGGPMLVLGTLLAARDFKLLYRLLRRAARAPDMLYARALGLPRRRVVRAHLLPALRHDLLALMMTSVIVALGLLVPVEVIFDTPGLGQLAWAAAMNRDLPVLLAVTLLVAACVAVAGALADARRTVEVLS